MRSLILLLTLMLSGRMMTLAFIHRAGRGGIGDPPIAWLMPLIGDAVIGVSGLLVAYLLAKRAGLWVWTAALIWNALGIWDAMSAYIVHLTTPWPAFFMIQAFGGAMFFIAAAMHAILITLLLRASVMQHYFGADPRPTITPPVRQ
ncbi:MAG: hypothetical protein COB65_00900 [Thalassobium sp.]|uniref:hypothetical protein n=1 Tax=Octadecabacter sp. SW4 TaxID=2602067 RepID=UPI000C1095B2|nr:hypothetical protein [Octadecabacter sp. SW4]PHQ86650.1 MAG: hypothetical protein COB65_00900 [Thalassobium sp.]QEE34541.1 hypothetical protein FTO60_01740 [Octadecabacter sp. SW4]